MTKTKETKQTTQEQFMDDFFASGGETQGLSSSPFFKITKDETNVGTVVFRLLPMSEANGRPFLMYWRHDMKIGDKYVNIKCDKNNHQKECPICNLQSAVWDKYGKDAGISFFPKQKFLVNILIVKDPAKPENNGKVFPFIISNGSNPKGGKGLFSGILKMVKGDKVRDPLNLFSPKTGADLIYTIDYNSNPADHKIEKGDKEDRSKQINAKLIKEQPLFSDIEEVELITEEKFNEVDDLVRSHYKMYTKKQAENIDNTSHETSTSELTKSSEGVEDEPLEDEVMDLLK